MDFAAVILFIALISALAIVVTLISFREKWGPWFYRRAIIKGKSPHIIQRHRDRLVRFGIPDDVIARHHQRAIEKADSILNPNRPEISTSTVCTVEKASTPPS
ncbi:MAG: hypothetical protein PHS07_00835 [Patescibacteria group bacterium]|nr:hypothetical protein [Patescibacteria group bacterium]